MSDSLSFRTTVELGGKTATGLQVPDDIVSALGGGRRPAVRVTIGSYTYRTTVASMGGRYLVPLSAEHRAAAGVAAGDEVDVTIEADTEAREVPVPDDLSAALDHDDAARRFFDGLAYTHRQEWVRWVEDAKRPETRERRLEATLDALRSGRRSR
jgi:Bacteriocin-protection, YdeI or OmpD-Associated/Domain of unknown function (DUF1905)